MNEYTLFGYDGNDNLIIYIKAQSLHSPGGALEQTAGFWSSGAPDFAVAGIHADALDSGYRVMELNGAIKP